MAELYGMDSCALLKSKTLRRVLLLGDTHFCGSVEPYVRLLDRISEADLKEKIHFLVERGDLSHMPEEKRIIANVLGLIESYEGKLKEKCSFTYYEPRTDIINSCLTTSMNTLISLIEVSTPEGSRRDFFEGDHDKINSLSAEHEEIWKTGLENVKLQLNKEITVADCRNYLEKCLAQMRAIQAKYAHEQKLHAAMGICIDRFIAAQNSVFSIFTNPNSPLEESLFDLADMFSGANRLAIIEGMCQNLLHNTTYLYFDFCFFDKMSESLAGDNNNHVCAIVGDAHWENLVSFFEALDRLVEHKCNLVEVHSAFVTAYKKDVVPVITATVIYSFIGGSAIRGPQPVPAQNFSCWFCQKKLDTPKTCGKCKQAKYCDPVCQRKHWLTHKQSCNEPIGKI